MVRFFVLLSIVLLISCRKEKTAANQNSCTGTQTFTKNISANLGTATLLGIYEDINGNIHVSANDNGTWKVFQFNDSGTYIRTANLGNYNTGNTLNVKDAYYVTSYTESYPGYANPEFFNGWKEIRDFTNVTGCFSSYVQDTLAYPIGTHLATTVINKISFTGGNIWTNNYNGYLPNGNTPIIFSSTGGMYLFTIDYKGPQRLFLINGTVYTYNDSMPVFYGNDTMLLNDTIHSFIISNINPSNGGVVWQKTHLFDYYEGYMSAIFSPTVLNTGPMISCGEVIYSFDSSGNYIRDIHPLHNDCFANLGFAFMKADFGGNNIFIQGNYQATSFLAQTDGSGNPVWSINYTNTAAQQLIPSTTGFIATTNGNNFTLFSQTGVLSTDLQLCSYISSCNAGNCVSYTCISCSGNILHAFSTTPGTTPAYWLVRTKADGTM